MRTQKKYTNEEIISISKKMVEVINLFRQEVKDKNCWKSSELMNFAKGLVPFPQSIPSILHKGGFTKKVGKSGLQFTSANSPVSYVDISELVKDQIEILQGYWVNKKSKAKVENKPKKVEKQIELKAGKVIDTQYCINFLKNRVNLIAGAMEVYKQKAIRFMEADNLIEAKASMEEIEKLKEEKLALLAEIGGILK